MSLLLMNSAFLQTCRQICDVLSMSKSTSYDPIAFNSNAFQKVWFNYLIHWSPSSQVGYIATFCSSLLFNKLTCKWMLETVKSFYLTVAGTQVSAYYCWSLHSSNTARVEVEYVSIHASACHWKCVCIYHLLCVFPFQQVYFDRVIFFWVSIPQNICSHSHKEFEWRLLPIYICLLRANV